MVKNKSEIDTRYILDHVLNDDSNYAKDTHNKSETYTFSLDKQTEKKDAPTPIDAEV